MSQSSLLTYANPRRRLTQRQWQKYEQVGLAPSLDLDALALNWTDRKIADLDALGALTGLSIDRTIEGGSTITLTLRDPHRRIFDPRRGRTVDSRKRTQAKRRNPVVADEGFDPILPPSLSGQAMEIQLDGVVFRLVKVAYVHASSETTLTFEDRLIYWLKRKRGAKRADRRDVTRAEFILSLLREIRTAQHRYVCPELTTVQRLGKAAPPSSGGTVDTVDESNQATGGISPSAPVKVKGRSATPQQRRVGAEVLAVADKLKASPKARLALIEACIVESEMKNLSVATDLDSLGVLQLRVGLHGRANATSVEKSVTLFLTRGFTGRGGAMKLAKSGLSAGQVAQAVQGSAFPDRYDAVKADAQSWLDAWGGSSTDDSGAGQTSGVEKPYQFARGKDESSWEAMQRLAGEVGWRCFVVGNSLYYMSEPQLYARRLRYAVEPDDPAVLDLTYDVDWGKKTSEASLTVALDRWGAPPGSTISLHGFGPPDGRWLVKAVQRDYFSPTATVTLVQPGKALLEPPAEREQRATNAAGGDAADTVSADDGSKGMEVYNAAAAIDKQGLPYTWGGGHGRAGTPDGGTGRDPGPGYDCSGSVCAALAAAGLGYQRGGKVDVSGTMAASWGQPGKGRQFTVWANSSHVWIEWHGLGNAKRFDTSPHGSGGRGPHQRFTERSTDGFTARHWPGV